MFWLRSYSLSVASDGGQPGASNSPSNKPDAENPAVALPLTIESLWRRVSDPERFRTPLVKARRKPKQKPKRDLLVGTWLNGSEWASEVEFTITRSGDSYAIRLRDGYDGEESEVFDTAWDGEVLSFATHWKSTGRFARYRLSLSSTNRLDVTYTYTDHEMYHRQRAKRNANPAPP